MPLLSVKIQIMDMAIEKGKVSKKGIPATALAERLGISDMTVGRKWKKGQDYFAEWSKKLDPNNKAWSKDPDRTFYQLIDD